MIGFLLVSLHAGGIQSRIWYYARKRLNNIALDASYGTEGVYGNSSALCQLFFNEIKKVAGLQKDGGTV